MRDVFRQVPRVEYLLQRVHTISEPGMHPLTHAPTHQSNPTTTHPPSVELKRMPLGTVGAGEGGLRRMAVAGPGLVNGPTVLRSGAMSTEVALRHGDGRIRVTFQHVPAWKQDREQGVGLPDALGLYRVVVRREALRPRAPTKVSERPGHGPLASTHGPPSFCTPSHSRPTRRRRRKPPRPTARRAPTTR